MQQQTTYQYSALGIKWSWPLKKDRRYSQVVNQSYKCECQQHINKVVPINVFVQIIKILNGETKQ